MILVSGHDDARHLVLEHEPVVARILKPATPAKIQDAINLALAAKR